MPSSGSRMPRADIPRPGLTAPGPRVLASPARAGRNRRTAVVPLGEAPSDHGQRRPARPGCLILCHPVSPPGRTKVESCFTFTTVPGTQKALSLVGKGPYLRKLVAGEGFAPSTSGLWVNRSPSTQAHRVYLVQRVPCSGRRGVSPRLGSLCLSTVSLLHPLLQRGAST